MVERYAPAPPAQEAPTISRSRWGITPIVLVSLGLLAGQASAHGDDEVGGIQGLLGVFEVMVASSFFHSIGAILLVGGLILLMIRLRIAEAEDDGEEADTLDRDTDDDEILQATMLRPDVEIPGMATRLLYVGIVMNLLGGAARLFEPGHPSLLEMFANRWVGIMLVKHTFILTMCICTILATLNTNRIERRLLLCRFSLGCVIVIGLLGALAGVVSNSA
ncbi:MAG TPA: hypothetical protein EYO09_03725 [Candidatus Poseidoniales archaeon]|nr:hypothetical protein [Candidatus Poseidoniales archaeon]